MNKEVKLFLMVFLVLGVGFFSNEINITGKTHFSEQSINFNKIESPENEINIISSPSEANVYISGNFVGKTPLTLNSLSSGDYEIVLKKVGYYNLKEKINLNQEIKELRPELIKIGEGNLIVDSNVEGAEIYIDNELKGFTPYKLYLKEGFYDVKISKENYIDFFIVKTLKAGQSVKLFADLNKEKHGTVNIATEPNEANIFVDEKYYGKSPGVLKLKEGNYDIKVEKENYEDQIHNINVLNKKNIDLNLKLQPSLNTFFVESEPLGAKIYVDGKYIGITPHVITGLSKGFHEIKLSKQYYEDYFGFVNIGKDENKIKVNLVRK